MNPSTVIFINSSGVSQASQVVRIESDSRSSPIRSVAGLSPRRQVIVFGVKDHPDESIVDTAMVEGWYFNFENDRYTIVDVIVTLGEIQGVAEASR